MRGPTGNLKTMIELGPKLRSTAVMEASKPVRMALTPMMVPVPMITPSTVRKARSLWVRMVCERQHDAVEEGQSGHDLSFRPQGLDGIEPGGAPRRIDAEEQSHHGRETHADEDRRPRQRHRHRGERCAPARRCTRPSSTPTRPPAPARAPRIPPGTD